MAEQIGQEGPPKNADLEELDPQERKRITNFYNKRLKILRKGRESFQQNEVRAAVEHYSQYLNGLAMWKGVHEDNLSPDCFDRGQDLAELLLISHVYWDLAKAYDRSPSFQAEVIKSLDQFCRFTVGFKYQYANAQVVKKFIKRPIVRHKRDFQRAYERVRVRTKGCYIATYAFGDAHPATRELRDFRDSFLIRTRAGIFSSGPMKPIPLKLSLSLRPIQESVFLWVSSF